MTFRRFCAVGLFCAFVFPFPAAEAQLSGDTDGLVSYALQSHHTGSAPDFLGLLVVVGPTDVTDVNNNVWEAGAEYWFWDAGPAWPTNNPNGDDGFWISVAATQSLYTSYDPDLADFVYDNDAFTSFSDDVGISGGTKRFKIWRVPVSGSNVLLGYAKEAEPSYDLSWYAYQGQVNLSGQFQLTSNDLRWWFEPTTSTFNEDDIGIIDQAPW